MNRRCFAATIFYRDEYPDVVGIKLCVFDGDIKVVTGLEKPCIEQFELGLVATSLLILC